MHCLIIKWTHSAYISIWVAPFIWHSAFEIHWCCVYWYFILSFSWVIVHCSIYFCNCCVFILNSLTYSLKHVLAADCISLFPGSRILKFNGLHWFCIHLYIVFRTSGSEGPWAIMDYSQTMKPSRVPTLELWGNWDSERSHCYMFRNMNLSHYKAKTSCPFHHRIFLMLWNA